MSRTAGPCTVALAAFGLFPVALLAQTPAPDASVPRVSGTFIGPLAEVLESLSTVSGRRIVAAGNLGQEVQVRLRFMGAPWDQALDSIAQVYRLSVVELPDGVLMVTRAPPTDPDPADRARAETPGAAPDPADSARAENTDARWVVDPCPVGVTAVTPTVSVNPEDVFLSWAPECAAAVLLVEEGSSDRWGFTSPMESWGTPAEANVILPGLFYGDTPPRGTVEVVAPAALAPGVTYRLVLWRVLADDDLGNCVTRRENACLVGTAEFTR